jgi:chromosome partitioning protein
MLSQRGKTLAVDFDPQGNLSQWLGITDLSECATIAETILPDTERMQVKEIIHTKLRSEVVF